MMRHKLLFSIIILQFLVIASFVIYLSMSQPSALQAEPLPQSTTQHYPSDKLALPTGPAVMNSDNTELVFGSTPAETAIAAEVEDQHQIHRRVALNLTNTITEVEQRFQSEPIDQDWAYSQQQNLLDLFHTAEPLRGIRVEGVTCLESVCKLQVGEFSDEPFVDMMKIQREWIAQEWYREGARSFMKFDEIEGSHVIYFER